MNHGATTTQQPICTCHGKPSADGAILCREGTDDLAMLLRWLTADISRADREPARDGAGQIVPGSAGRMPSTIWDTPSGESRNLPRMLDESAAKLAVRTSHAKLRAVHAEPPLPLDLRAVDDAGRIRETVGRWATVTSGRRVPLDAAWDVPTVAAWLISELPAIRLHDWAATMLAEVRRVVERAERHIDVAPVRRHLGICGVVPEPVEDEPPAPACAGQVFAVDGALRGRCNVCAAEHDVAQRQEAQAERLRDVRLTAAEIERVTASLDRPVRRNTITQWHKRGHLAVDGGGRYLVGDVLRLAERAAARRAQKASA